MGILTSSDPGEKTEVRTVYTAPGHMAGGVKSRLWVLEDRSVIHIVANGNKLERQQLGMLTELKQLGRRDFLLVFDTGLETQWREKDCNCGMGIVGNAAPVEGRWRIIRVRRPEWFTLEDS